MKSKVAWIAVLSLLIIAATVFIGETPYIRGFQGDSSAKLQKVKNEDHLIYLLKAYERRNSYNYGFFSRGFSETIVEEAMDGAAPESPAAAPAESAKSNDFSETNIQVAGVDEGDIIKTDGEYIYHIQHYRLNIFKAYPAEELSLIKSINFDDFYFQEIYIHDNQLIIIGNKHQSMNDAEISEKLTSSKEARIMPPYNYYKNFAKVIVMDRTKDFNILKEFEIEGNYFSSRRVNDNLYMVTNKSMYTYMPMARQTSFGRYEYTEKLVIETPYYKEDKAPLDNIPVEDIYYFPNFSTPEYMTISTLNLADLSKTVHLETYIGASHSIYASTENLYVANTQYQHNNTIWERNTNTESKTEIHKIKLEDGKTSYIGSGIVDGRILNQFSMDEREGYFRIATTTGEAWRNDEFTSKNHLFVLDNNLKVVGSVMDIAPTERIYSMRFMGDKAYMVTFRETDPFYVIDLKEPTSPKILGYLKIPGYSNYLHPYDENHIIGFGKEVHETKNGFFDGGVKIAVFDVSDVTNPIEKFKVEIGGRGTHSELLYNHKALLFDKSRNLLALPITVYSEEASAENFWYGNFEFQGVYVYQLDMENGFNLKGKITHLAEDDYMKAGSYYYYGDKNIQRILRIEDTLYTVSGQELRANRLQDLMEVRSIKVN